MILVESKKSGGVYELRAGQYGTWGLCRYDSEDINDMDISVGPYGLLNKYYPVNRAATALLRDIEAHYKEYYRVDNLDEEEVVL